MTMRIQRSYGVGDFAGQSEPRRSGLALGSKADESAARPRIGRGPVAQGRHQGGVQTMTFTPDARRVVTDGNSQVTVWDVSRGAIAERLTGRRGSIWALDVSPTGARW